jgi:glycosyltransferase involved in cell wall biosynthesis
MPMKVYDAMAMASPIVASTVSDLPIALEGCARLVPPKKVDPLADALRDLLEHPAEARSLGERARQRCLEKYSMKHVADALLHAIRTVVAT